MKVVKGSLFNGYVYVKPKELANSVLSYECKKYQHSNCNSKVKDYGNEVVGHLNDHTHTADKRQPEVLFVCRK